MSSWSFQVKNKIVVLNKITIGTDGHEMQRILKQVENGNVGDQDWGFDII